MRNKKLYHLVLIISLTLQLFSCKPQNPPDEIQTGFAKGADVSWLTEMEKAGRNFYTRENQKQECMSLLQDLGFNSIRLRVWVNPKDGWCNKQDLLIKARRANDLKMRLMINFHYSDVWADPGKQFKPESWTGYSLEELKMAVASHTKEVLQALKEENIVPEWVQVGNETGNGMLWETGKASVNMKNYAELNNAGYDAVKSVFPNSKVIVHIQEGDKNSLFRWIFDGLRSNGGKWDVIGMSLYPTKDNWQQKNRAILVNIKDMITRYEKEVMICEVGMPWDQADISFQFLSDLIAKAKSVENEKCLGVFYWEPQSNRNWKGYTLGAFDNSGKPTVALDAFKN